MFLKKIKLHGFKSFPENTTLEFREGLTAIVGPNGCGKSNIVDSIMWVLGEQRPSILRGERMEDVIFKGTENKSAVGMAEVELTLGNASEINDNGDEELTILRRLYRSGESEYRINGRRSRLKDIRGLFYGTGIGKRFYTVIEQGMVDAVLSTAPEERRRIFEEAAGIFGYKMKKQEAQRRLEATRMNVERAKDIKGELESQARSLRRQASRAKRYLNLREELSSLEVYVAYMRLQGNEETLEKLKMELDELNNKRENLSSEISSLEKLLSEKRSDDARFAVIINEKVEGKNRVQTDIASIEGNIKLHEERIKTAGVRISEIEEEQKALTRKRGRIIEEIKRLEGKDTGFMARIDFIEYITRKRARLIDKRMQNLERLNSELESARARAYEATYELSRLQNEINDKRTLVNKIETKIEALKREKVGLMARDEECKRGLSLIEKELKRFKKEKKLLNGDIENVRGKIDGLNVEVNKTREELKEAEFRLARVKGAIEDLSAIPPASVIYGYKVISDEIGDSGIKKGDLKPKQGYEKAFRAATFLLNYVISTKDEKEMQRIIKGVKKSADVLFKIPLDKGRSIVRRDAVLGYMTDYVVGDGADELFGDMLLIKDIKGALTLLKDGVIPRSGLVTLDGYLILPDGTIFASLSDVSNRDLEKVSALDISSLEEHIARLRSKKEEREKQIQELSKELEVKESKVEKLEVEEEKLAIRKSALLDEKKRIERSLDVCLLDMEDAEGELMEYIKTLKDIEDEFKSAKGKEEKVRREVDRVSELINVHRFKIERSNNALKRLEIERRNAKNRLGDCVERLEHFRRELIEIDERMDRTRLEIPELKEMMEQSEVEIKSLESEVAKLNESLKNYDSELFQLRSERSEIEKEISKLEIDLKSREESAFNLNESVLRLKEEIGRLSGETRAEVDSISRSYNVSLVDYEPEDELVGLGVDEAQLKIEEVRDKLSKMGEINFEAEREYERVRKRIENMDAQLEDLKEAEENLIETISYLDKTSRNFLVDMIEKVDKQFKELFNKIFKGGNARIYLKEGVDPLKADILIEAIPEGKRLSTIHLLSGGEKAMVAIILLFAILNVKPAPFCFLDEVDAALDDVNTVHFVDMLNFLKSRIQFILITHNRQTMEIVDNIIGITMEEAGVSKVISVSLKELAKG